MAYDDPAKSSSPQPKKTLEESSFNMAQNNKTVIEANPNQPHRIPTHRKDPLELIAIGDNNRYLLQHLLGQGGMSQVYQALDTKLKDRVVAIKLMTNSNTVNRNHLIKRFIGEVKAIASLKHPNIIQIFDFGFTPKEAPFYGSPFYVMEYLPGQTLQHLLTENKKVPLDCLLKIISQVCVGLKEAHQQGIVHRDLKPDNIFLVNGGAFGEIIKILDFGIAKNLSFGDINQTKLTQEGSFIGTYRYASPEQCRGLASIDQRTDIYSLGVILYEAICGKNPYDLDNDFSNSQADWIACHIRVPPKSIKEQPGCQNLPDELANIVMQCLAKSPQDRFSDIGALPDALANSLLVGKGLNYDSLIDKEVVEKPEAKNSYQSTKKLEVAPDTPQTVLENHKNNFVNNVISSSKSQKVSVGLLAGLVAFLIAIVGTIGYLGMYFLLGRPNKIARNDLSSTLASDSNNSNDLNLLLEKLKSQYEQGDYQNCYQLATKPSNQDNSIIQEWIGKCGLAAAKAKAEVNSFSGAIAIATTIPNTVPNYQEIQDNIDIWSSKVLDYATKLYQQGKLEEAIKTTQIIPDNSNLKAKVPDVISQWQQEEEKHQTIIANAQNLLNRGQWAAAKQEVEKIPSDFVFWQQEAQPILAIANQKINGIIEAERRRRAQQNRRRNKLRPRRQQSRPTVQPKETQPLPSLRDKLKNIPLLDDDTLKERLQRNPSPSK